jgi:hypothetical protein
MSLSFSQTYILASKVRSKLTKQANDPKVRLSNLVVQANMLDNLMDSISSFAEERNKATQSSGESHVTFNVSTPHSSLRTVTSVSEYEVDLDSDDEDSDDEYYVDEDDEDDDIDYEESYVTTTGVSISSSHTLQVVDRSVEDDDSDDYYYSSEDEEPSSLHQLSEILSSVTQSSMDLSTIEEAYESEESDESRSDYDSRAQDILEMPELCSSKSLSDEEIDDNDTVSVKNYICTSNDGSKSCPPSMFKTQTFPPVNSPNTVPKSHSHSRSNALYSMEQLF